MPEFDPFYDEDMPRLEQAVAGLLQTMNDQEPLADVLLAMARLNDAMEACRPNLPAIEFEVKVSAKD